MYKTISIQNATYQGLQVIATRLHKPKSQVIDELIKVYIEGIKETEKQELQEHNKFVSSLADRIKLPKGTKIKSEDLDKELSILANQNL